MNSWGGISQGGGDPAKMPLARSSSKDRQVGPVPETDDFEADLHVVGHTPVTSIESRYGGELIPVDLFEPAAELLLLVRDEGLSGYHRWRFGLEGPPQPL